MADRAELLERLEALQGPDRGVDLALHTATNPPLRKGFRFGVVPAYTASIDAAVALVEKVLPDAEVLAISRTKSGGWGAGVNGHVKVGSTNGAIAILIALLRSLEAKEGER